MSDFVFILRLSQLELLWFIGLTLVKWSCLLVGLS